MTAENEMTKSREEKVMDFADRWTPDMSGRFEIVLIDGRQSLI
jgi:hypothetical protein